MTSTGGSSTVPATSLQTLDMFGLRRLRHRHGKMRRFWLHGDLHPANVIVSDGTLSGVIDFGELCAGDPATDLAAAWLLLPAGTTSRFFDVYADVDDATIRRAKGWAVLKAVALIGIGWKWEQGLPGGKQTWGPAGRAALERVLVAAGH